MNVNRIFALGTIVVVIAGLALAFEFLGTPARQRLLVLDDLRVRDLREIASVLHDRYGAGGVPTQLPSDLIGHDPETKRSYEFRRVDATHYVLCATFATPGPGEVAGYEYHELQYVWPRREWRHRAGRQCYELDVSSSPPMPHPE